MQFLKATVLRPESLETFKPVSSKVKSENDAAEIGFPTLTNDAFLNQTPNKQTSHE